MAQKMTLAAYLVQRGKKAKALTKGEAELLGIPYPLRAGWPRRHGAIEIEEGMLEQLAACGRAAQQTLEEKKRRAQVKAVRVTLAGQMPLQVATTPAVRVSPVAGFVLRQARRYRTRRPAPWA
jgi:hypothetical protein